jgi:hypothetical protein
VKGERLALDVADGSEGRPWSGRAAVGAGDRGVDVERGRRGKNVARLAAWPRESGLFHAGFGSFRDMRTASRAQQYAPRAVAGARLPGIQTYSEL